MQRIAGRATAVCCALVAGAAFAAPATAATTVVVVHQGEVTSQDVASQPGSEPDTVVEPDVAVSPLNKDIAIAAAHDSRFPDGGAVDVSAAWTTDGGAHWQHQAVPGITTAGGGQYDRASDPVVAFGPDGTAYLSVLLLDATTCPTAVAVLRSTDGGHSWSAPSYAHQSASCDYSDDKNWLVVDNSPASPHFGRVYQFWTPFRYDGNHYLGSPQALRWSDDHGHTWSNTSYLTGLDHATQDSQPMIKPDGSIVDTYYDFGVGGKAPDSAPNGQPHRPAAATADLPASPIDATGSIYAETSTDGGATWSTATEVTTNGGGYADGIRCCLFAADIDPVTHLMYVAWEGGVGDTDPVYVSSSPSGTRWSSPIRVSRGDVNGVQRVNVDVAARAGEVFVSYGTRTQPNKQGGFVQQQLSVSNDRGRTFGPPLSIGPRSVLRYAAQAGGYFPGDYIGAAVAPGRLYLVWAVSSKPPAGSASPYHQIIYGATLSV